MAGARKPSVFRGGGRVYSYIPKQMYKKTNTNEPEGTKKHVSGERDAHRTGNERKEDT